ncbi:MAG: peptidyl-prolyl cis-trans isomerase [Chthoniobacterales bacterium]|nr:peptidyl-prolyl cis-trans isomerase [Chthoniobacterales bacterium]
MIPFVRLFPCTCVVLLSFLVPGRVAAQQERMVDGIAAVVNSNIITYGQVRELLMFRQRSLSENYKGDELRDKMKESQDAALKDLVDRQLIIDSFKEQGFQIPDHIIQDQINKIIREEFGGDRTAFVRTLKAQGFTLPRFREIERDKIIVQAMRQRAVRSDFVISPDKIEEYYRKNVAEYSTPEEIRLSMIVLRPDETGAAENAVEAKRVMAQEIRGKLADGADFAGMAQMYSDDSTADLGGDWGWIDRKTLTADLNKVAFSLSPGQLSDVVQVGDTFYIMRVEARKAATTKPLAELREEIGKKLFEEERIRLQEQWLETLRKKAYVKIY